MSYFILCVCLIMSVKVLYVEHHFAAGMGKPAAVAFLYRNNNNNSLIHIIIIIIVHDNCTLPSLAFLGFSSP